jgi:hypothetical protein
MRSTLGIAKIDKEVFKFDFLTYHRKDLDWMAFVFILLTVNLGLVAIDELYLTGTYD